MALSYIGDCTWKPLGEPEPSDPPNELPTTREPWLGRMDQVAAFRAQYFVGRSYLGGFIIANSPQSHSPGMLEIDLVIARPPNFQASLTATTRSIKTASKSATINNSSIIKGETEIKAVRSVSFYAPETRYTFFAADSPNGPRFTKSLGTRKPQILSAVITCNGASGKERTFAGANAPAALLSALSMPEVDTVVSDGGEPIAGTPWFRCTDTVTREFKGDG